MKKRIRKLCAVMCLATLCIHMIPAVAAADLATELLGEQVISSDSLRNLAPTGIEGVLQTAEGEYLRETDDGGYIVLKKHDVSFEDRGLLQTQMATLNLPDEVKERVMDKYETLRQNGEEKGVRVSIYEGVSKVNRNGRSFIDDLPVVEKEGRQFKVYTLTYDDIEIRETIKSGNSVVPMLKNTTSFGLTIFGMTPAAEGYAVILGVISAGMTLFDICETALNSQITGSLDDEHWIDATYSSVENIYYIYSEALSGWNQALMTESVSISKMTFTTYVVHNPEPGKYVGEKADVRTYRNLNYKTESFDDPFPVAVQYQFLGKSEEISMKYQGKWIYF